LRGQPPLRITPIRGDDLKDDRQLVQDFSAYLRRHAVLEQLRVVPNKREDRRADLGRALIPE
jgi:hypothetical protein